MKPVVCCRYRGGSGDLRMDRKTDKEKERPRLAKTAIQDLEALIDSAIDRNLSSKTSKSGAKESKGANDINENLEGIVDRMSGVQIGKDNITEDQVGKGNFFGLNLSWHWPTFLLFVCKYWLIT